MKHLAARWCLMGLGILVMAAGIVIVTKSATGNTPISSTGYVLSVAYPAVSYGVFMFGWNVFLLLMQVVILRSRFRLSSLVQIPISVLFSIGIDSFSHVFSFMVPPNYAVSLLLLALGIVVLAAGVACTVVANVALNCGEALVAAITMKTGWNFGHTKVGFDISCVAFACITSFALMGNLVGVREGTVAAAAITGFVVNFFVKLMGGVRPAVPMRKKATAGVSAQSESAEKPAAQTQQAAN